MPTLRATNILLNQRVFCRKDFMYSNGSQGVKFKARLVTRGFKEVNYIDFNEPFLLVVYF